MPRRPRRADPALKHALGQTICRLAQNRNPWAMAVRMGIRVPEASVLFRGELRIFSLERLMILVTRLGHDVEIVVRPAPRIALRPQRHGSLSVHDESDPNAL
jgi:predicted XRE-type DNA-binding protein